MNEYRGCIVCSAYATGRLPVLAPAFRERRQQTGETSLQILDRYMTGVHERHLSGLSLAVTA